MNVLSLAAAAAHDDVGGKATNLSRLIAAGIPVPDGFVLHNAALQHFVAEQECLPPEMDAAVVTAWQQLASPVVIVRSSAMGEDSEDASFAGQLDSIPNVTSAAALRRAILAVWNSQWSSRSLAYQSSRGTFLQGMGVVIQRQIDAAVSGVLFTESPQSNAEMLLEYCGGMGEALVSGAVNPGRVTIRRDDGRWTAVCAPDEACAADALLLNDAQMATLARLALRIERAFGSPQDIEWTVDREGALWIVQSRPITGPKVRGSEGPKVRRSAGPKVHGSAGPRVHGSEGPKVFWSNANVNENFPQPISPLLYSVARAGYYHYFRNLGRAFGVSERRLARMEPALRQIIGVHGARMYYNLSSIHHVLRSVPFGDQLATSFDQFVGSEHDHDIRESSSKTAWQGIEVAAIALKTAWQYAFLTSRVRQFEDTVDRYAAETHPDELAAKPLHALVADLRGFMDIRCNRWKNASLADAGSMVCYGLLKRLLARAFPQDDQQALHNTLLKALPDLVSGMPPVRMWELSRLIRQDETLHALFCTSPAGVVLAAVRTDLRFAAFRRALDEFLEQWGFRCSAELMLTAPSFQEDPGPLIDLLKSYAAMDGESPADLLERQAAGRMRDTERVMSTLRWRPLFRWLPVPQSLVVGTVLSWTQRSIQLRERARLKQALLYSRLRRVVLALGAELVRRNRLHAQDDVFLLTVEELDLLASGGDMFPDHVRQVVTVRRVAHAELSAMQPPDAMEVPQGEYFVAGSSDPRPPGPSDLRTLGPSDPARALSGVGACGGSTRARAAILLDVTESHRLEPGDVLVTRQTDPGWGPIFPLISGLVIERGGMLSHGAIIAREFGIPSVVGVQDATRLIRHGGSITVDGDRGLVLLEQEQAL